LDYVIKYLSNPLKTGVYNSKFTVEFSGLEQLFREIAGYAEKSKRRSTEFIKTADEVRERRLHLAYIVQKLDEALRELVVFRECPREILEFFGLEHISKHIEDVAMEIVRRDIIHELYMRRRRSVLDSCIFDEIPDVALVEKTETDRPNELLIDVTTVKEGGMLKFEEFIKSIPHVGKTFNQVSKRRSFSSRYTFQPYALAVKLWLGHETALPKDLRDFLSGAVRYHFSEEWRTSIVLSAITVESMLADIYEEKFKEYAPNVPLGELYYKVKDKTDFPPDIARAIEIVNESRIAAVHRSRFPVSDREATNALYGATTFTMWYSSNF